MRRLLLTTLTIALAGLVTATAHAAPVAMCVPTAAGAAITTPESGGTCAAGTTKKELAEQADLDSAKARVAELETLLAGVTRATVNGRRCASAASTCSSSTGAARRAASTAAAT